MPAAIFTPSSPPPLGLVLNKRVQHPGFFGSAMNHPGSVCRDGRDAWAQYEPACSTFDTALVTAPWLVRMINSSVSLSLPASCIKLVDLPRLYIYGPIELTPLPLSHHLLQPIHARPFLLIRRQARIIRLHQSPPSLSISSSQVDH